MMITPAQRAEIRRLYFGEHWKVDTIATALGVHHQTVRRAIELDTRPLRRARRASTLDPFLPFIRDTRAQYPRLRATRLHEMLRQRGYPGSARQVRRLVRHLRPTVPARVYRRVVTLAAEQAQVDWGTFGTIPIGRGVRTVSGFVMVLGYSRARFALFTLDQTLESFLRGHVAACEAFGGSARTLVYDNLRSAVLDRRGTAIQFHPRLLELAGHYHFAPQPCTPGRGNEKGQIERQIQYLRHAFFAARPLREVDDLNTQFRRWRDEVAYARRHPEHRDRTVAEVFAEEQPRLLPLPAHPFATALMRAVRSGKTPYVRFDRNSYSIPHTCVRHPLTLLASATTVRLVDGTTEVARHRRSYGTGETIELPEHILVPLETEFRGPVVGDGEGVRPIIRQQIQIRALHGDEFCAVALNHLEAEPLGLRLGHGLVPRHDATVSIDEHGPARSVRADGVGHGLSTTGGSAIRVLRIRDQVR